MTIIYEKKTVGQDKYGKTYWSNIELCKTAKYFYYNTWDMHQGSYSSVKFPINEKSKKLVDNVINKNKRYFRSEIEEIAGKIIIVK